MAALKGLESRLREIHSYLDLVAQGKLPLKHDTLYGVQVRGKRRERVGENTSGDDRRLRRDWRMVRVKASRVSIQCEWKTCDSGRQSQGI